MSKRLRPAILVALVAVPALVLGVSAQQQQQPPPPQGQKPAAQQQPTFRAGINFVRVDVIVTDRKGAPVDDLQPGDFQIAEDGKPQKVETFKLVRLTGEGAAPEEPPRPIRSQFDEESEAARDDVRLFAIFLDDYHVRRSSSMVVRAPLDRFISMRLSPQDMVGIMYPLTPLSDVMLTRDREATVHAIDQFEGRKYDYRPRNDIEEKYSMYPASVVERIRNQVTLSALKALVIHLGSLREGRKAVILVSEGFSNTLPPQLRDPVAAFPGLGNPARGNPTMTGDPTTEDRAAFFASSDLQADLREIYDAANKSNTAIYALDPRGLAPSEFQIDEGVGLETDRNYLESTMDTLRVLADQTDGRAIVNRNDLEGGLRQIIQDSSAYYLIGYSSTETPADGKFHEIKVKVNRPGVQVRARKGYWALTADEKATALAPPKPGPPPAVQQALSTLVMPPGRLTRNWIGTSRGENGRTRVTFVWEPVPPPPGATRRQEPQAVALIAAGADGSPYFRGRVPDTAAAPGAAVAPGSVPAGAQVTFDADPGRMEMRIAVEGAGSAVLDSEVRELVVPDLTLPQLAMSTPVLYRARTARDFRLIMADPQAVPTAVRDFSRSDRLLVRVQVYGPGGSSPAPSARLLNRMGEPMTTVAVRAPAAGSRDWTVDLPLAGLAAGEYLLELSATAESGTVTHLVAMHVTN